MHADQDARTESTDMMKGTNSRRKRRLGSDSGLTSLEALCLLPQMRRNSDSGASGIGVWRWREKGVLCLVPALISLVKYNARSRVEGHRCMEFEERG